MSSAVKPCSSLPSISCNSKFIIAGPSSQHGDDIAGADGSLFQYDGEDSLPGHDAVAHLLADGAVGMAFLSDLGPLQQDFSNPEPGAPREGVKDQPSVKLPREYPGKPLSFSLCSPVPVG